MSPIDANMVTPILRGRSAPKSGSVGRWLQAKGELHTWDATVAGAGGPPRRMREQQGMNATDHRGVSTTVVLVTTVATVGGRTTDARKRRIAGDVEGALASGFVEVDAGAAGVAPA